MSAYLEVGVASRPIAGERVCGDQFGVFEHGEATTIILADGLGHGPEATAASTRAVELVREHVALNLTAILQQCHLGLRGSRGAAVTLIRVDGKTRTLGHIGIGNVEMMSISREPVRPINMPGIVGVRMRKVLESQHRIHAGDLFLLHTDGISSRLDLQVFRGMKPELVAHEILARHAKDRDDAGCVVARVAP